MNLEYRNLLPKEFDPKSRVWIYQSNRILSLNEVLDLEEMLEKFLLQWNSHGSPVKGYANLFFGQFIILMADESSTDVSGCSTDSSVHFIKEIEQRFRINLFDRQMLAFLINEKVQIIPMSQLKYAAEHYFISAKTIYFNNLVQTKEEMENKWMVPVKESWLSNKISFPESVA